MTSSTNLITNRIVEALQPGEQVWDSKIAGFGARCQKKASVYVLKKRINGRQRWMTIGKHGEPWTAKTARDEAVRLLGAIADGENPALKRQTVKNRPTVADLCKRYIEDHAKEHKKASSIEIDESYIRNHIEPLLGRHLVVDLSVSDIDKFKRDVKSGKSARGKVQKRGGNAVKGGEITANRCLALLSKAFNLAVKWGWRSDNPVSHVSKYKENKIERFLSELEFAALGDALRLLETQEMNPYAIAAIRLLIFTGARRDEILGLKWSEVDLERGLLLLEDSKTGKKPLYLNAPAKQVLASLDRQKNNPYVICGAKETSHLVNLRKAWDKVRKTATVLIWMQDSVVADRIKSVSPNLKLAATFESAKTALFDAEISPVGSLMDVRIHDLRHSFASVAAMGGLTLTVIGKLLGHSQSTTTERYAHLADDPLRAANEAVGGKLNVLVHRSLRADSSNRQAKS